MASPSIWQRPCSTHLVTRDFSAEHFSLRPVAQAREGKPLNAIVGDLDGQKLSPTQSARLIADRLEELGHDPFRSDRERYLVLLEDRPGDIIELGRPLRGSRLFKKSVLARDITMINDIKSFAAECKGEEWLYWNIGLTAAKADVGSLVEANEEFNRLINIHFREMRRRNGFQLILIVVHPRFDPVSGRFDLHAHFICRIPREHREAARQRLLTVFSKADVPDDPVRNAVACATYMIWGIADPQETIELLDDALSDLWRLSRAKARLVRTGERFGKWRAAARAAERERQGLSRKKTKRTANPQPQPEGHDRLLAKTMATIGGKKIAAMVFERSPVVSEENGAAPSTVPVGTSLADSSSATIRITQDSTNPTTIQVVETSDAPKTNTPAKAPERGIGRGVGDWTRKPIRTVTVAVVRMLRAFTALLRAIAPRGLVRCRGPPR